MKKLFIISYAAAGIILSASCKKDSSTEPVNNTASLKIKTYTETVTSPNGNYGATFNLSYDANDRIISMVSTTNPGDKFLFGYPSAGKIIFDIYNSGVLSIHEDYFLNSNSIVDSTFQYNDTKDTLTEKYFYNAGKQLIKLKQYEYSKISGASLWNTIDYTYDTNGNLIKATGTDMNINEYEYYADLIYISPNISGIPNPDAGKKKNLVKKHTLKSNGFLVDSVVYTYTFDAQNRMITKTQTGTDGTVAKTTYTYY